MSAGEPANCATCHYRIAYEKEHARYNESVRIAKAHADACLKKFQQENPCPKCGSHNTDIDWGTPMFCRDCGHEW